MKKYLVTGAAGFIGSWVCQILLQQGHLVIGIDNLNSYYDVELKKARLKSLCSGEKFDFIALDICDASALQVLFQRYGFNQVIHLAAQAGVRYSMENPSAYVESNLVGFANILENCRHYPVEHLIYASSSAVYGQSFNFPLREDQVLELPRSLYAATKQSNELLAQSYAHLYQIPSTGLRFFTVYGEWGRPDMAVFKFTLNILNNEPITLFNQGDVWRSFTHISDVAAATVAVSKCIPTKQAGQAHSVCARVLNIGGSQSYQLKAVVALLEQCLGQVANKVFEALPASDVYRTQADSSALKALIGFEPEVLLEEGIERFVRWYCRYRRGEA